MAADYHLDREAKTEAVRRIQAYFANERGEELGQLAAGLLFDFIIEELAPLFYNAGLADAQALLARAVDGLDADLEAQHRFPPREPRLRASDDARGP